MRERCHECWNLVCTCYGVPDWEPYAEDADDDEAVYTQQVSQRPRFRFFEDVVAPFLSLGALLWVGALLSPAFAPEMTDSLISAFAYMVVALFVGCGIFAVVWLFRTLFFRL